MPRTTTRLTLAPLLIAITLLALPRLAEAAAPANDDRADAQAIAKLPASVRGTTVGATLEKDEDKQEICGLENGGSVWFSFTAPADGRIVLNLDADGDLDAVVEVLRRVRSQTISEDCDSTDERGNGAIELRARKGNTYLVRVARRKNSVEGTFKLDILNPQPDAKPPGPRLPRNGVRDTVQRVLDPDDAWSVTLREGRTYRFALSARGTSCDSAAIYPPGTNSFNSGRTVAFLPCDGYGLFTPGPREGGRYSIRVQARGSARGKQSYHLQVGPAGADDIAPGRFITNRANVSGRLDGSRLDFVDLYRFDVVDRSNLLLVLDSSGEQDFDLRLVNDAGRRVACSCGDGGEERISRRIRPGRYYAAVEAASGARGRYTLRRVSRSITRTVITVNGKPRAESLPGAALRFGVAISPGATGPVTLIIQRHDPFVGWQFHRRVVVTASGGQASYSFSPPAVGRWRAKAFYEGSPTFARSASGYARALVAAPLRQ